MSIQIYLDSANLSEIMQYASNDAISGFTTNPTLMRKAGVINATDFAKEAAQIVGDKPISFEVSSENPKEFIGQAQRISNLGKNIFVKIPVVDSNGKSLIPEILILLKEGIRVNITAVFCIDQITKFLQEDTANVETIISCFAGRIADTQRDPIPIVHEIRNSISQSNIKLLWASAREVLNVYHAEQARADIITLTQDLISKMQLKDRDLVTYSIETSRMFFKDAATSELHF